MRYLVITMLLLSGCGRMNAANYTCNQEQQERLDKSVVECAKDSLQTKINCWQAIVKNICTYKE